MRRTVCIKLDMTAEQNAMLISLQKVFNQTCNIVASIAMENRCWNRVALHSLSYDRIRQNNPPSPISFGVTGMDDQIVLGSQMVCNSIKTVCDAYKVLKIKATEPVPTITFKQTSSVHFDKRTYSLKGEKISLYTLSGRILVSMNLGEFQRSYLQRGLPKEAELIYKRGQWFFNLVLDILDTKPLSCSGKALGVDLGENNIAATSSGKIFGGGELCHDRDCALALRGRLQSNGSESSKQLLKKISGKEARHVGHVNHEVSKAIIQEALATGCDTIAMESLTNIRLRIRAGKRIRSRLHRWAWAQLQEFILYKAQAAGVNVVFVNPAYTSQMCATCGQIGSRQKHRLECKFCGVQRHSDLNASLNIRRIAMSADVATGTVNCPNVATA
jgi:IS605 OrfB family transposase